MPGAFISESSSVENMNVMLRKRLSKPVRRSSLSFSKTLNYDTDGEEQDKEEHIVGSADDRSRMSGFSISTFQLCQGCKAKAQSSAPVVVTPPGTAASSPTSARRRRSSCRESLVGSYEESLLSGRMSTGSSAPVKFHARIGALGKGKYAKHCPPHLNTDFDAVFYDWRGISESSPYTGCIDLDTAYAHRRDCEFKGYRIPKQGQIQIVVSNSQRTAVQLYLVPYDLRKMPQNTKTFLRQKIYEQNPKSLVQTVHLQVACPQGDKQRLYLYGEIRLAFQNRVSGPWPGQGSKKSDASIPASPNPSGSTSFLVAKNTKVEVVAGGFGVLWPEREQQVETAERFVECDTGIGIDSDEEVDKMET